MRAFVLAALLAGCNVGDFIVPAFGPEGPCPGPWIEKALASGVVAVTRDDCGFPDASLDYRLYWRGTMFADGHMETNYWELAVGSGFELRLPDRRCTVASEVSCTPCAGGPACLP